MASSPSFILALTWPLTLEYYPWWQAGLAFVVLATPILLLGVRSLVGLGPVRRWVAIGARLLVLLILILILAGARWQRTNKDVEVIALRDISESTNLVHEYPGETLQRSIEEYLVAASDAKHKETTDRIGLIGFNEEALIDAPPSERLALDARALRPPGSGTDIAGAIQMALAAFKKDAMHRMLLISDGRPTSGDTDAAVNAAIAQKVPIDVMPLHYDVKNEVIVERMVAPTWLRENDPFTLDVILLSTNTVPVTGKLTVRHGADFLDLDPPNNKTVRQITVPPGLHREPVYVPRLAATGPHQFYASFEPDVLNDANKAATSAGEAVAGANGVSGAARAGGAGAGAGAGATVNVGTPPAGAARAAKPAAAPMKPGDTLVQNNSASAFLFVRGKGKILYVDNVPDGRGSQLRDALTRERLELETIKVDQFPTNAIDLQRYDAVILANVPRGADGLSEDQQKLLATYVHEMGGGLVMIGGDNTFGAGGWAGSKLEEVLPVSMDIPAQRQIPKGALVLVIHSCEMPEGTYWGRQCAIKAAETLSSRDEIGVISVQGAGPIWDFPLSPKGDGSKVMSAIKAMVPTDFFSFDDSITTALHGAPGQPGLLKSDARQKHIIIVSDGDPQMPGQDLIKDCQKNKITISTVTVYGHQPGARSPQMEDMAKLTGGRAYGPIESNPNQLPQIFIKEATVVRRSLITEDNKGIPTRYIPSSSDIAKGLEAGVPPIFGMVLTTKKQNPQIEMPLVAGNNNDPLLAIWQSGLGRAVVFTSDAHNRWSAAWVGSPLYDKFWANAVRGVARPPMSSDLEVTTTQVGDNKGKIVVEALNKDAGFVNFLSATAQVINPDPSKPAQQIPLVQTGPGVYEGTFDAKDAGAYCAVVNTTASNGTSGGMTLSGLVVNQSPELRELSSNESLLRQIQQRTGGRWLEPWNAEAADLFTRKDLPPSASPLPIWDILIPLLLALILIDVAIRRIAWDWNSTKRMALAGAEFVRSFTTTRRVETRQTVDALKRVREEVTESRLRGDPVKPPAPPAQSRPDPRAKFEAGKGVEGDITQVVGGATNKPVPPPPKTIAPKGAPGEAGASMSSLMAAKRRAQEKIREKEEGKE